MKIFIQTLSLAFLLLASCKNEKRDDIPSPEQQSTNYSGPIIDMHIHAYEEGHPMFGMTHPPTLRGKIYDGVNSAIEQKKKTFEKFKQYNIVKAVVTNGHLWDEKNDGFILTGNADKEIEDLKIQFKENKLQVIAEVAPFYAGIQANDPSLIPYFELAQTLNVPVGFHVFPGGPNNGIHLMPKMLSGMRAINANPLQLEDILVKFPKLRLYIMHGGWPYVDDVKALMYMYQNLYVDIAVLNWVLPQKEFEDYLKTLIKAGFGDRILFGTDQMVWPETIDDAIESVNAADFLTFEQKEDIFYDNAAKFLELSDDEIKRHKSN